MNDTILILTEKTEAESEQVAAAWMNKGGQVLRLGKYWIKDEGLTGKKIAVYGNLAFVLVMAQIYNLQLLSPDDALIARLSREWTKRDIRLQQLGTIHEHQLPAFIKPVTPKLFTAQVVQNFDAFKEVTIGLPHTEEILLAEIVKGIQAEARSFILNGTIMDMAVYEGNASLETGKEFLSSFIAQYRDALPAALVIDIAFTEDTGWFLLEFNACWGSGLNNCTAEKVIDCIIAATLNETAVSP